MDTELPASGGVYDHPANGVLWVALAEKAYAEANGYGYVTTGSAGSDSYAALNGGRAGVGVAGDHRASRPATISINPSNIAAAWNAGQLIVIYTSAPTNSVHRAQTTPTPWSATMRRAANPFEVYNPWGTNSSGWALGTYNGHAVYGLFNANAAFLSQNFVGQAVGVGDAADQGKGQQPATTTNNPATNSVPASPSTVGYHDDSLWAFVGTTAHKHGPSADLLADLVSWN